MSVPVPNKVPSERQFFGMSVSIDRMVPKDLKDALGGNKQALKALKGSVDRYVSQVNLQKNCSIEDELNIKPIIK